MHHSLRCGGRESAPAQELWHGFPLFLACVHCIPQGPFSHIKCPLSPLSESCSVVSDSLQPHGLYNPWNSLGQNTGVGGLSLLQGIFPTQESHPGLLNCRWILYQLSHKRSPISHMSSSKRLLFKGSLLECVQCGTDYPQEDRLTKLSSKSVGHGVLRSQIARILCACPWHLDSWSFILPSLRVVTVRLYGSGTTPQPWTIETVQRAGLMPVGEEGGCQEGLIS